MLIDNASTYPPLVQYLHDCPHDVWQLQVNIGSQALWQAQIVPDEPFVLTDPDLIPVDDCPHDLVDHLAEALAQRPDFPKAGPGLYLEDVPADLPCLEWERSLVSPDRLVEPGVYGSLIDTTFALYRAGAPFVYDGLRCGFPYQMRHMPWYVRPEEADEEDAYYLAHAIRGVGGTTSWNV